METRIKQYGPDLTWLRHTHATTMRHTLTVTWQFAQQFHHRHLLPFSFSPFRWKQGRLSREAQLRWRWQTAVTSRWRPSLWKTQLVIWKLTGEDKGLNPGSQRRRMAAGTHACPLSSQLFVLQLILNTWMASCGPRHVNSSRSSHAVHFSLNLCVLCAKGGCHEMYIRSAVSRGSMICLSATRNIFTLFALWFVSSSIGKWWVI